MKRLILLLLLISQFCVAQNSLVTETIKEINIQGDTLKSVYEWITDNISYDVKKLNKIKENYKNKSKSKNKVVSQTKAERNAEMLQKVIQNKKGVCEDYSLLFDAIVKELGYESHIIEGYTKNSRGILNRKIGHVWNTVKVNGQWKLYDATWGSGSVKDGKTFIKKYNPKWYAADPSDMAKTHMPFDPIWQMSAQPLTYQEFESGKTTTAKGGDQYDYNRLIADFDRKDEKARTEDMIRRSKALGEGTSLIGRWRKRHQKSLGIQNKNSKIDQLNEASANSNQAYQLFKQYLEARQNSFKGEEYTVEKSKGKLQKAHDLITSTLDTYKTVKVDSRRSMNSINKSIKQCEVLKGQMETELTFLESK